MAAVPLTMSRLVFLSSCTHATAAQDLPIFNTTNWNIEAGHFRAVDDVVRGGNSVSRLDVVGGGEKGTRRARFWGTVDTSTLGGAGFASQSHTFEKALDLSPYTRGFRLRLKRSARLEALTAFTLNLKDTRPAKGPDGRTESSVVHEYAFDVKKDLKIKPGEERDLIVPWNSFKETYRGREVPKNGRLGLRRQHIVEISIMCRSNFNKQHGDFELDWIGLTALRECEECEKRREMLFYGSLFGLFFVIMFFYRNWDDFHLIFK
ncbi:CIA30-domain-containing protein [Atractiella rhizophila]|nr:CIA30-domain-containing protein [Atractiella rhizophila]